MVWYFIGVYIINRTLHGRLEIQNFSSRVENISLVRYAHSGNFFQHSKKNSVSPRGHVISSMYDKIDIRNLQSEKHENRCLETSLECSDALNFISQHFAKTF